MMTYGLDRRAMLLLFLAVALAHAAVIFCLTVFFSPRPRHSSLQITIRTIQPLSGMHALASPAQTAADHLQPTPAAADSHSPNRTAPKPVIPAAGQNQAMPPAAQTSSIAHAANTATTGASGSSTSGASTSSSGKSTTPPSYQAAHLRNPAPDYPLLARKRGWQGRVVLKVHVSSNGNPEEIRVQASSGFALLDKTATDSVRHWRFVPARRGDVAVDGWVMVPLDFKLDDDQPGL